MIILNIYLQDVLQMLIMAFKALILQFSVDETVLAAWMRLKYPHIAVGALASSAPILQFEDIVPPETFYSIVSNDFRVSNHPSLTRILIKVYWFY